MRRKLLAPAAFAGVLLVASYAWAPPPRPAPPRPAPPRPTPSPARPPIGSAKPAFGKTFEAARAKSATEAAALLRTQGAFLARSERAAMLNVIAHQLLRQQQAVSLAELRRIRADWSAIGSGAGLDPIVAMELEAAESAAERLMLAEILQLVRDGRFTEAADKIGALESPRYLPAAVVQALPALEAELRRFVPVAWAQTQLRNPELPLTDLKAKFAGAPKSDLTATISRGGDAWAALWNARALLQGFWDGWPGEKRPVYTLDAYERALKEVAAHAGDGVAKKIRAEMAARLVFEGRPKDATQLLEGEVDPVHAAAVLADLKAAVFGRGAFTVAQVANSLPSAFDPPVCSVAILPPDQLAKWKLPSSPAVETTVFVAIGEARRKVKAAVETEVTAGAAKVTAAADRVRAALAAEAAPLKAFLEKVEAVRGKPLTVPVQRELAAVAGTRGLTVAETIGVLAADADRPAAAARLLATVPVFTNPGAFAAAVEVSSRAPAGFTAHPDAGFKVPTAATRARVRDAVAAILGAHASKAAAGQNPPPLDRAGLEADVAKRLGVEANAIQPAEFVQALLDVCRDWANDHARLNEAARSLDELIAEIEDAQRDEDSAELRDEFAIAKTRRVSVQFERKRAEIGVGDGCQLLGGYGSAGAPAVDWLDAQVKSGDKPWHAVAALNLARIAGGK